MVHPYFTVEGRQRERQRMQEGYDRLRTMVAYTKLLVPERLGETNADGDIDVKQESSKRLNSILRRIAENIPDGL